MTPAPGRCTRSGGQCRLASRAAPAPRDVSVGAGGPGDGEEGRGPRGGAGGREGGGRGSRRTEDGVEQKGQEGQEFGQKAQPCRVQAEAGGREMQINREKVKGRKERREYLLVKKMGK